MTNIWHDYSKHNDLQPVANLVGDVAEVAGDTWSRTMIVGAFARDLHLHYRYGIEVTRKTGDLDFAIALPSWRAFSALSHGLIESGSFDAIPKTTHRLRHRTGLLIDFVPFGGIETPKRMLHWPKPDQTVMDIFGAREAMETAHLIVFPGDVEARLVSYPALLALKLVTWQGRHLQQPRKDAADIDLLLRRYMDTGKQSRVWEEFSCWLEDEDYDHEVAGARMLGVDIWRTLGEEVGNHVLSIVEPQCSTERPGVLPMEMGEETQSRDLLMALSRGISEPG